jgi:NAD(P)-dependent dehydrogenase (short-subunit alcohol dehydrogenase family)
MSRLDGRLAVVTGASSGIGLATAHRLIDVGASVVAVSDRPEELAALEGTDGIVATAVIDVSNADDVERLGRTAAAFGGADILVNNAGIWSESDPLDLSLATWRRTLEVNVTGPFLCSQVFARQMRDAGGGCIVNTASTNGLVAEPRLALGRPADPPGHSVGAPVARDG